MTLTLTARPGDPAAIDDPALAAATRAVLSRWIGDRKRPPGSAHPLGLALEMYAATEVGVRENFAAAPLGPAFRSVERPPSNDTIARRLAPMGAADVRRSWQRAEMDYGADAVLPESLVAAVIPRELWPAAAAFLTDGPELAKRRTDRLLYDKRDEQAPANRRRQPGRISDGTLQQYGSAIKRLMRCAQAAANHSSGTLGAWAGAVPKIASVRGLAEVSNLANPSRREIRLAYARLHADVLARLACQPGEELAAAERLTAAQIRHAGLFRALRSWAFFTLLCVTGSRADALVRLRRRDYQRTLLTGYGTGPTLVLEPLKTHEDEYVSHKPLGGAAYPLEVFLAALKAAYGRDLPDDHPLFPVAPTRLSDPWTYSSVNRWCVGKSDQHGKVAQRALIPLTDDDPALGYAPHRYRATAAQQLESRAAAHYLDQHGIDRPQRYLSEVLLDHALGSVEATYKLGKRAGREEMAGHAIAILWELLAGDVGARRVPDSERYAQALRERRALRQEKSNLQREYEKLAQRFTGGRVSGEEVVLGFMQVQSRRDDVADELAALDIEIERIENNDPSTFVAVPDDLPDDQISVDLSAIRLSVLGVADPLSAARRRNRLRDWLTLNEFAVHVAGVSAKQGRRWVNGEVSPPGTSPWKCGRPPVQELSPNRRRVLAAGLSDAWLDGVPGRRERMEEVLRDWPAEANWNRHRDEAATPPGWLTEAVAA